MGNCFIKIGMVVAVVGLIAFGLACPGAHMCRAEEEPSTRQVDPSADEAKDKKAPPRIYDTEADGNKQIDDALKLAKAKRKRVLLKFGELVWLVPQAQQMLQDRTGGRQSLEGSLRACSDRRGCEGR